MGRSPSPAIKHLRSPVNNQEALDLIWECFVINKSQFSVIGNSGEEIMPLYIKSDTVFCPIGLLMSRDDYLPELEGQSIDSIYDRIPSLFGIEPEFLLAIQFAYDECATNYAAGVTTEGKARKDFKYALRRKIIKQFGLSIPTIEKEDDRDSITVIRRSVTSNGGI